MKRIIQDGSFDDRYVSQERKITLIREADRAAHFLEIYQSLEFTERKQLISTLERRYQDDVIKLQNCLS